MKLSPSLRKAAALGMVAVLVAIGLSLAVTPYAEDYPEGDLPAFLSEAQMRRYLGERQDLRNDYLISDDMSGAESYHSTTNVQVLGVDELDTVKTNGIVICASSYSEVTIVLPDAEGNISMASRITAYDLLVRDDAVAYIHGIFLLGDTLTVVMTEARVGSSHSEGMFIFYPEEPRTVCSTLDLSDPSDPIFLSRHSVTGWYLGSRMIDERIFVLSEEHIWRTGEISMPQRELDGKDVEMRAEDIRFDPQAQEADSFLNILSMDVRSDESNISSLVMGRSSVIYVSMDDIYLTNVVYRRVPSEDMMPAPPSTNIYRLHLEGLQVVPEAKGSVEGYPKDQFCLDEHEGVLRVATFTWWSGGESRIYALDQDLEVIGSLTGIAPGETIQAARFRGPTLYLVTFLFTDPLFVIDLTDPANPEVLGELVVPGFSNYLHPCSDSLIAGIGLENSTLKVSLYDVQDPADPRELETVYAPAGAWSDALWDHKSVLFDERYGILLLPMIAPSEDDGVPRQMIMAVHIGQEGLEQMAVLEVGSWYGAVRCIVIDDILFTVTEKEIMTWSMIGFERISDLNIGAVPQPGTHDDGIIETDADR